MSRTTETMSRDLETMSRDLGITAEMRDNGMNEREALVILLRNLQDGGETQGERGKRNMEIVITLGGLQLYIWRGRLCERADTEKDKNDGVGKRRGITSTAKLNFG